jgi:hypothetical protein
MRARNKKICRPGDYGLGVLRACLGSPSQHFVPAGRNEEDFGRTRFDRRTSPRHYDSGAEV